MTDSLLLLDTCAIIWIGNDEAIDEEARSEIETALLAGGPVYISPFSAWEIGQLASRGRLSLPMTPEKWFNRFLAAPGIKLADMPPEILIASSFLPGALLADLTDRILVATAREFGLRLVTRDCKILAYAEAGYCRALAC